MIYEIKQLDKRHTYHYLFDYYIGFDSRMSINFGPANFNRALKWFIETYGYSAEVGQYASILQYYRDLKLYSPKVAEKTGNHYCNSLWSWSLGYNDLRIYTASEKEVSFFQLAHPIDQ